MSIQWSEERTNILKAIFECKKEFSPVSKSKTNDYKNYKYTDINGILEVVEPILHKYGLMLVQPVSDCGDMKVMETTLIHIETGEFCITPHTFEPNPDIQKMGAQYTYLRRYGVASLLGLRQEDTDGTDQKGKPVQSGQRQQKPQPQQQQKEFDPRPWFAKIERELGLTTDDIGRYMRKPVEKFERGDYAKLKKLLQQLKTGEVKVADVKGQ